MCRKYGATLVACNPPFGQTPDCHSPLALRVISSPACADAYGQLFNVSVATLVNISSNTQAINTACNGITVEV